VLTFPIGRTRKHRAQSAIDRRISPQDILVLKDFAGLASVKGGGFGRFARSCPPYRRTIIFSAACRLERADRHRL